MNEHYDHGVLSAEHKRSKFMWPSRALFQRDKGIHWVHNSPLLIHSFQVDIPRIIGWRSSAYARQEKELRPKGEERRTEKLSSRLLSQRECACIRLYNRVGVALDPPQENNNPVSQTSRLRGAMTDVKQFYNGKKVLVTGAGKGRHYAH
jgi:hypothetical protein